MALQTSITLESGIELFNAYFKITQACLKLDLNSDFNIAEIHVSTFRDQQARQDQLQPVLVLTYFARGDEYKQFFDYDKLQDSNIVRQAYFFLKTKPLFQGASDV
ncbi:MAG: hypothetical protein DRH04_02035 [Deltaproteobacteria bacterium]|nr:MAG: hypothetical protein DRH04_02035 [Deltaproteobacteria bacterium]